MSADDASGVASAMVPDLFVVPSDQGGRFIVYAPLARAAFETDATGVRLMQGVAEGLVAAAASGPVAALLALQRKLGILDPARVLEPAGAQVGAFAPTTVTLFLTTNCNLRCTYCYASTGETPARTMSWAVAVAALNYVQQNVLRTGAQSAELRLHGGGEPTLAWPLLVRVVEYMDGFCQAHGLDLGVSLSTNGILTDAQIDYVVGHCTSINVSFDGLASVQDRQRPTVLGDASFPAVVHTLERLDEAEFRYGIRITVTERSLAMMVPSVEWLSRRFRPSVIHLEPSFALGRGTAVSESPPAFEAFLDGFRRCRQAVAGTEVPVHYSGANLDVVTSHFCGVTRDSFAVTTEGVASSCYEAFLEEDPRGSEFFYGRLDRASGEWQFDADRIQALRRMTVRAKPYCQGCFVKWHCAGDCHHRASAAAQGDGFRGTPRCPLNRELTRDLLVERVRAGGGVWKERPE